MESRSAVLIVNTKSRRGKELFGLAQQKLEALDVHLDAVHSFKTIGELIQETRDAIASKAPLVVLGGGDGTFSTVSRYFAHSESVMGVLPLGTGNQFARDLGIPPDLDVACEIVARGKVARVDLGVVEQTTFLNVATVGVTTAIALSLTEESKRRLGRFVYVAAILRALRKAKPFHAVLETEHGRTEFDTLQIVLGNGRYHAGPFPISPGASITEGRISLYALNTRNRAAFLKLALLLPTGRHVALSDVIHEETVGGVLKTSPALPVTVDGEVCARTPFRFSVAPDALRVMAPHSFPG